MGVSVNGAYSSLIQGVSQQSPQARLDGQHEAQQNMSNDPERGLLRRPPTNLIAYMGKPADIYKEFELNHVKYILAVYNEDEKIRVFNTDAGAEVDVQVDDSIEYFTSAKSLRGISTDEGVFITNPSYETKMVQEYYPYPSIGMGLVGILGAAYGRAYYVSVGTTAGGYGTAGLQMPNGSVANHVNYARTDTIANSLAVTSGDATWQWNVGMNSVPAIANYTVRGVNSDIIGIGSAYSGFSMAAQDSYATNSITGFMHKGTVRRTGLLTRYGIGNFCVKVSGAENTASDDYWLRFVRDDESVGSITNVTPAAGIWQESVAPDVYYKIDSTTMPRKITLNDDGTLLISKIEWADRRVGDDLTNPVPSFIDNTINDIALFQGRLVFLSGSNVIMSRSNKYFDFWKNSATSLASDDVIDISSATTTSTPIMNKAVPHERDLIIFAKDAQFIVRGTNAITPSNASLVLSTTYESNDEADPVASGHNIFYAIDYGNNTGIKEFYTDSDSDLNNSRAVTSHCTQYLQGRAQMLAATTNFDSLLVQTHKDKHILYLYEFIWINNEKQQSAWSEWVFQHNVEYFYFDNDELVMVCADELEQSYLLKIFLDRPDDGIGYQAHIDHKVIVQDVHKEFVLPSDLLDMDDITFVQGPGCPNPGLDILIDSFDDYNVKLQHSMNGGSVLVGTKYNSCTTFTRPVHRDNEGKAIITGTLTVHHFEMVLQKSGFVQVQISSPYFEPYTYDISMWTLDSAVNRLGTPALSDAVWSVPFMHDIDTASMTVSTDRATPLRITQLSWKGDLIKRGQYI